MGKRVLWLLVCLTVLIRASADDAAVHPALRPLVGHVLSHRDGKAAWSLDFSVLDGNRSSLPIGVFDSGIGGLTVLEALLTLDAFDNKSLQPKPDGVPDFAGERFIYFGDQANMPYGNYPSKGREAFLKELVVKDAVFLLGRRYRPTPAAEPRFDKPPVKAIVIACNTATAFGIEDIRAALKAWGLDVPVIGVVEAGAQAVTERLPGKGRPDTVAVLATVGTCACNAYPKAIARAAGLAGKPLPRIVQQGSVGLAGAIEGNPAFVVPRELADKRPVPYQGPTLSGLDSTWLSVCGFDRSGTIGDMGRPDTCQLNSVRNYARFDVACLIRNSRLETGPPIGMVVLGCTHFPLAQREIAGAFDRLRKHQQPDGTQPFKNTSAENLKFINPAEFTAKELFRALARSRLRAKASNAEPAWPHSVFFISVPNPSANAVKLAADGSLDADYKYSRDAGRLDAEDTTVVPMTESSLPGSSAVLVKSLPAVWAELHGKQ